MAVKITRDLPARSPTIAATLSFLWPGLGQWYLGDRRSAVLLAVPIGVVLLALVVWMSAGVERVIVDLVAGSTPAILAAAFVVAGAWRLGAMAHAAWLVGGTPVFRRPSTGVTVALLAVVVVVTHLWAASVSWSIFQGAERVFAPDHPSGATPTPSPSPSDPFALIPPGATPETPDARLNVLLTGIDHSEQRTTTLTDTLIVASVDPVTGDVALISFPRDIARFPLSDGRRFDGKINSLMTYANTHPDEFPGGGLATLVRELGFLLGSPVHYYAAVDLDGFGQLIDAVGGVTIDNPRAINDPTYTGWKDGHVGFFLSVGQHLLDGETALAYARSRKGVGDSDFTRAARQQQILLAIRQRLTDPTLLLQLPSIISAASAIVSTNFPRDRIDEMLAIARALEEDESVRRVVLGPPYATRPPAGTTQVYELVLDMDRIAKLSIELFGEDSRYAVVD